MKPLTSPLVCAPLGAEAAALRSTTGLTVLRTGRGPHRATRAGARLAGAGRPVLVAGIAGGLVAGLHPGDVVVAGEVRPADGDGPPLPMPDAAALAAALRRRGLTVHRGAVASAHRIAHGRARDRLAATGALAVDTESYWLLREAGDRAVGCVRVVADAPPGAVLRPATLTAVRAALRVLPAVGGALTEWSVDRSSDDAAPASPVLLQIAGHEQAG